MRRNSRARGRSVALDSTPHTFASKSTRLSAARIFARQFVGRRRQCRATRLPDLAIMAPGVFGRYVAPEWGCLAVGGASLCVSAFSNAFAPKAMGRVVDAYAKRSKDGGAGLRVELRRTACVFAVGALASGVRVSCFSRALQKALRRLRADVFDAALRRKASFFVLGDGLLAGRTHSCWCRGACARVRGKFSLTAGAERHARAVLFIIKIFDFLQGVMHASASSP